MNLIMIGPIQKLGLLHVATFLTILQQHLDITSTPFLITMFSMLFLLFLLFLTQYKEQFEKQRKNKQLESSSNSSLSSPSFSLQVTGFHWNSFTNKFEYVLVGQYKGIQWSCKKSFSGLLALKELLNGMPATSHFPRKSSVLQTLLGNNSDYHFIFQRQNEFNIFFTKLFHDQETFEGLICEKPILRSLLDIPKEIEIISPKINMDEVSQIATRALAITNENIVYAQTEQGGNGWKFLDRNKAGNVYCLLKEENGLTYVMCRGIIDKFDKLQVMKFLRRVEKRKEWDEFFKFEQILEEISPFNEKGVCDTKGLIGLGEYDVLCLQVIRSGTMSPAKAFVAERDSVCLETVVRRKSDGTLIHTYRSVPSHPRAPEGAEDYVRAKVEAGSFVFEDRKDGKPGCVLYSLGMFDPNGNIPKWVINLALKNNAWQPWTLINAMDKLE